MGVREHDRPHVTAVAPDSPQCLVQRIPRPPDSGIDESDRAVVVLEHEPVRVGVLDAVDALDCIDLQLQSGPIGD
jgi:hypothetical protein